MSTRQGFATRHDVEQRSEQSAVAGEDDKAPLHYGHFGRVPDVPGDKADGRDHFDEPKQDHTGEHLVWLKPDFTCDNVNLTSTISVWSMQPQAVGGAWKLVEMHRAGYNQEGE